MTYAMPQSRKKKRNMEGRRDRYRVTSIRNAISKCSMQCYAMLRGASRCEHRLRIRTEPILRGNTITTYNRPRLYLYCSANCLERRRDNPIACTSSIPALSFSPLPPLTPPGINRIRHSILLPPLLPPFHT